MEHKQMREVFLPVFHKASKGYFSHWGQVFKKIFKKCNPNKAIQQRT